jgi:ribosome biogenesis GTPase
MRQDGLVIAGHGRHVVVESPDGGRRICHPRGKKNHAVVGDRVWWQASEDEGTIEALQERRNLLYRQDEIRTKSFAANLDKVLILMAAEPEFSEMQLTRALIAAQAAGISPLIALNKQDLTQAFERAWERLAPYRTMGYQVCPLSLRHDAGTLESLSRELQGQTTLVLGPSGVGKSTLINGLVPDALAATNDISQALHSGKHTTTSTTLYWVDRAQGTALIDSPGFQSFGIHHIEPAQLAMCMPDLKAHADHCRFYNCTHLHEPGCGVREALSQGLISASRHKIYEQLFSELSQPAF